MPTYSKECSCGNLVQIGTRQYAAAIEGQCKCGKKLVLQLDINSTESEGAV